MVSIFPRMRRALCLFLALVMLLGLLPTQAFAADTGTTNAKVVLRKRADADSKALQTLDKGEEVDILGTSGSWYRVRYGAFTGYMMKKYVNAKTSSSSSSGSQSSSVSEKIKALGSAPGIMRPGDINRDVTKLQKALAILGYYDGTIDGNYGDGTEEAVRDYQKAKGLTVDGSAGKYTVRSIFGSCNSKSLTTQPDPTESGKSESSSSTSSHKYPTVDSISDIGSAPATSEKGDRGTDVVKLQQALECIGYYDGAIDGKYGDGTVKAVMRFQEKRGMKADGIAGSSTIRVLFGEAAADSGTSNSAKLKTEVPDWYKDNMTRVIPKNAKFTVKDVGTSRTFTMVRWSGADHMDAEPASEKDTQIIKEIYGGSYSWRRRPILVKYNGHVYAASMNGMPHGTTTIDNEFGGHLCIHFKNSKTHGSDKIDPDHQNAIEKASKYTW